MRAIIVTILLFLLIFYMFYLFSIMHEGSPLLETTKAGFPFRFYHYDPSDCETLPCSAKWNYLNLVLDIFIAFITAVVLRLSVKKLVAIIKKK